MMLLPTEDLLDEGWCHRMLLGALRPDYFTVRTITEVFRRRELDVVARVFPAHVWWPDSGDGFESGSPPFHVSVQGVVVNRDPTNGEWIVAHAPVRDRESFSGPV